MNLKIDEKELSSMNKLDKDFRKTTGSQEHSFIGQILMSLLSQKERRKWTGQRKTIWRNNG